MKQVTWARVKVSIVSHLHFLKVNGCKFKNNTVWDLLLFSMRKMQVTWIECYAIWFKITPPQQM
jgi:hypothetical protein